MPRSIEAGAACCKRIGNAHQFGERPLIPMPEEDVRTIGGRTRLGMNEVVSGADQKAKVSCGSFKLELLFGWLEPLHEVEERVGNAAGRTVF